MKNKMLNTLDISHCFSDNPENFEFFFQKFDQFCHIRNLTIEDLKPDISSSLESIGDAIGENVKLEALVLKDNKIKWVPYQNFWESMLTNKTLLKINLSKTDMSDRVVEKMCEYICQEDITLVDLDISKNHVSDAGLSILSRALKTNKSIRFLNMSNNKIREDGLNVLVEFLCENTLLEELSLGGNSINNDGIRGLSNFLPFNKTLRHLDIGRNTFTDAGFEQFGMAMAQNEGLAFLDIAKNKDLSDE